MTSKECKEILISKLDNIKNISESYAKSIAGEINTFESASIYDDIIDFYVDFFRKNNRNYFTITSHDTFNSFEDATEGFTFIYNPLNTHSRKYLHKGDVVFCYRQGQFKSLEDALDKRGIYAIGFALSEPKEIFPENTDHYKWGVAISLPIILNKHLELRNIQLNPITINLTPYNGNRNDALQYIEGKQYSNTLISMTIARNPEIKNDLERLLNEKFSIEMLPDEIWNKKKKVDSEKNVYFNTFSLQQIYYGAPGTGKSYKIREQEGNFSDVIRTTFHPDSDYSTFVGCYKPTMEKIVKQVNKNLSLQDLASTLNGFYNDPELGNVGGIQKFVLNYIEYLNGDVMSINISKLLQQAGITNNYSVEINKYVKFCKFLPKRAESKIVYSFVAQAFTKAYIEAWKKYNVEGEKPVLLVIEEINRGNCAQIFGDIFQLLDRNDYGFSDYPIDADHDLQKYIAENGELAVSEVYDSNGKDISEEINSGEKLMLPPNLYIWATMNTSDQSLFPIDSAFKRRWDWKYIPINTKKENWSIKVGNDFYRWSDFLKKINDKILSLTNSEDKQLGFYFCKANDNVIAAEKFVNKVLFYVYNDVYKDYDFEDGMFKDGENDKLTFRKYFDYDGNIVNENVKKFLDNLGVEKGF